MVLSTLLSHYKERRERLVKWMKQSSTRSWRNPADHRDEHELERLDREIARLEAEG